jgi:hypothetical protein
MKKTCLYIILKENTSFVKIGISNDFDKRFNSLNNHPEELIQLATYYDYFYDNEESDFNNKKKILEIEKKIHNLLKRKHVKGEWFDLDYNALKSLDSFLVNCCSLHPFYNDSSHFLLNLTDFFINSRFLESEMKAKKVWKNYTKYFNKDKEVI